MNIKGTGDASFDKAFRKLRRALVGLEGTDDRLVARRNARQRVLGALRKLRADLDERFPPVRAEGKTRVVRGYEGRVRSLQAQGWVRVQDVAIALVYAAAGVRPRRIKGTIERPHPSFTRKVIKTKLTSTWIPGWAAAIGHDHPSALRRARTDIVFRKATIAADTLQRSV